MMRVLSIVAVGLASLAWAPGTRAGSSIGDAGHFLEFASDILANNPQGQAFTITVHRHIWDTDFGNHGEYKVWVEDPHGAEVARGAIKILEPVTTLSVPAGEKGVYKIRYQGGGYALTWVECSLDQMVVHAGDWDMKDGPLRCFSLHLQAPRRWYFYVPPGTKKFSVKHTILPGESHREDYGFVVISPRGQRMAALYGGKPLDVETKKPNVPISIVQEVETDEGTTGRFWSIWATGGDSHNFSDLQILLKDVPPYFAPSPEQWFDPSTGRAPGKLVYDESQIRLLDQYCKPDATGRIVSRDHYLWTPAPFLGDEDYTGMRGPNTIYLLNPENRPIDFGVCTYVVNEKERLPVQYRVRGPRGQIVYEGRDTYGHHSSSRITIPAKGAGVYQVDVDASEWFAWDEPATPIVLAGHVTANGGAVFPLQIGIARHWFFLVPKGAEQFRVRVTVGDPSHVLLAEIHAPDRMMDVLYARGGVKETSEITVPPGQDGKIWFVRAEVGSATRFLSETTNSPSSRVRMNVDLELQGVPGYLAPTWEQWFDPKGKR